MSVRRLAISACLAAISISACGNGRNTAPPAHDLNIYFDCLEAADVTLVAAHRGGAIENSLTGMREIAQLLPALMEVDVAQSADGVLFLMHDDTLDRTTTGSGNISQMSWQDIENVRLRDGEGREISETPPTLTDALEWSAGKAILELDIKRSTDYDDLVSVVKQAGASHRVIYIAYSLEQALTLHRLHPDVMISYSVDDPQDIDQAVAAGLPADRMLGWTGTASPDKVVFDALNGADIEVIFGTLGGADSIDNRIAASGSDDYYAQLARDGVDIIATDAPIRAYEAMKKAGLPVDSPACSIPD